MKINRKIHLWLSVPFGVVISLICITGSILALQEEIIRVANRDVATLNVTDGGRIAIDKLAQSANAQMGDGAKTVQLIISSAPDQAYRFRMDDEDGAYVYANQYTGEVSQPRRQATFFNTVRKLHRFLLCSRPSDGGIYWGKTIVGISTLLLVVILITGIIAWWPRRGERLGHKFKIRWRQGFTKLNFDLHSNLGFYVALLLLVMAMTGLTWSFGWYKSLVYHMLGEDVPAASAHAAKGSTIEAIDYAAWDKALGQITAAGNYHTITFSSLKAEARNSQYGNMRDIDTYLFDAKGNITKVKRYDQSTRQTKIEAGSQLCTEAHSAASTARLFGL